MKSPLLVLMLVLASTAFLYSQNTTIQEPEFPSMENSLYELLDDEKITNPTLLQGNIKEVQTTFTLHKSPENVEAEIYVEKFKFDINGNLTEFVSSDEYDERDLSSFNNTYKSYQNDTVVKENNYSYVFKDGLLIYKYNFEDSISYSYKSDKLSIIKEFQREVVEEWNDDEETTVLYYTDYELKRYQEAIYNILDLLSSVTSYYVFYETINTYQVNYKYDQNNRLRSFNFQYKGFVSDVVDLSQSPNTWTFSEDFLVEGEDLYKEGTIQYDEKNRIINYQVQDSNKNQEKYSIKYIDNDFVIKVSRSDYDYKNDRIVSRDLEYIYTYDHFNNPVDIRSYIVYKDQKILDKSTEIKITYY